jgi:hypothetical protein
MRVRAAERGHPDPFPTAPDARDKPLAERHLNMAELSVFAQFIQGVDMKHSFLRAIAIGSLALCGSLAVTEASANTIWQWSYSGTGIDAKGILTASDTADSNGYYPILSISGKRNGDTISGLYPTGTAIPGNEPYAIDNLIKVGSSGQLTSEGFGYTLASGAHANPYFADFLFPQVYVEVFTQGSNFSEPTIVFSASQVPEASTAALSILGLAALAAVATGRRASRSAQ